MGHRQPGLSRTLPKDFTFYADDNVRPRTPEQPTKEPTIPPPPHHSSCRFRRPRLTMDNQRELFCSPDIPLPSIEFSYDPESSATTIFDLGLAQPATDDSLQVPPRGRIDPKTPPAQIRATPIEDRPCWTYGYAADEGSSIQRPSSACSNLSDSSVASSASFNSRHSMGGSCTSPESEILDPFLSYPLAGSKHVSESPSKPANVQAAPLNIQTKSHWTSEMDNHLWNTYQIYLQDPRITPFKMVPGSLPPLGVSHRVAREARKTWARAKNRSKKQPSAVPSIPIDCQEGGVTGKKRTSADAVSRSGSTTPTATTAIPPKPTWPKSDASTRRRLKELCKRKFSIAPHYQRLLQSRSPSPFLEPFAQPSSRPAQLGPSRRATSFATRDLGVSLVSSSMPSQVAELGQPVDGRDATPDTWFNSISEHEPPTLQVHSDALLDSNNPALAVPSSIPRLGSPFMYHTWGPEVSRRRLRSVTPASQCETIHVSSSRIRSPGRLDPFGNAHKRRALHQLGNEVDSSAGGLQRPFPDFARQPRWNDVGQRRVRVRNRGVTTGAISSREQLDQLFTPPVPFSTFVENTRQAQNNNTHLQPAEDIKRLGSPFHSDPFTAKPSPSHSPRHASSRSDPFIPTTFVDPAALAQHPGSTRRERSSSFFDRVDVPEVSCEGKGIPNTPFS
ncbi:hypothetical protein FQN55_007499 [Onygenales sp. PD_40]|nr:hypothetical protein FQN55_007499 [Onygenales sp. PD_40]